MINQTKEVRMYDYRRIGKSNVMMGLYLKKPIGKCPVTKKMVRLHNEVVKLRNEKMLPFGDHRNAYVLPVVFAGEVVDKVSGMSVDMVKFTEILGVPDIAKIDFTVTPLPVIVADRFRGVLGDMMRKYVDLAIEHAMQVLCNRAISAISVAQERIHRLEAGGKTIHRTLLKTIGATVKNGRNLNFTRSADVYEMYDRIEEKLLPHSLRLLRDDYEIRTMFLHSAQEIVNEYSRLCETAGQESSQDNQEF